MKFKIHPSYSTHCLRQFLEVDLRYRVRAYTQQLWSLRFELSSCFVRLPALPLKSYFVITVWLHEVYMHEGNMAA